MKITKVILVGIGTLLVVFMSKCEQKPEDRLYNDLRSLYINDSLSFAKVVLRNAPLGLSPSLLKSCEFSGKYTIDILKTGETGFLVKVSLNEDTVSINLIFDSNKDELYLEESEFKKIFFFNDSLSVNVSRDYFSKRKFNKAFEWLTYVDSTNLEVLFLKAEIHYHKFEYRFAQDLYEKLYNWGMDEAAINLSEIYTTYGNRPKAIKLLKEVAARGNPEAMMKLGDYYETYFAGFGYDPPEDATDQSSYRWYHKAAKLNHGFAMYRLGYLHEQGMKRPINLDSAYLWYRKSANIGFCSSSVALARYFLEGKYTRINLDSGMYWLDVAIIQNPARAYFELAEVYENGVGVAEDKGMALKYYIKSDSLGYRVAGSRIKKLESTLVPTL